MMLSAISIITHRNVIHSWADDSQVKIHKQTKTETLHFKASPFYYILCIVEAISIPCAKS